MSSKKFLFVIFFNNLVYQYNGKTVSNREVVCDVRFGKIGKCGMIVNTTDTHQSFNVADVSNKRQQYEVLEI